MSDNTLSSGSARKRKFLQLLEVAHDISECTTTKSIVM